MGKVHGTDSDGILRILLDTGASATIILKDAIRGLSGPVIKEQPTKWNTVGGQFVTTLQREIVTTRPDRHGYYGDVPHATYYYSEKPMYPR